VVGSTEKTQKEPRQRTERKQEEIEMARQWYGSLNNRLEENKMFCDEIQVGTGVTRYSYSDRHAYEVVAVQDQKHVSIREYDVKAKGDGFTNSWELVSNEENPVIDLVKRGDRWYRAVTATVEHINSDDINVRLWVLHNGFDVEKIRKSGKQTKYHKMDVSFGIADYYYDYSF
jgi:hypothetical protein